MDALRRSGNSTKIFGLFHDAKDMHYVISRARRDNLSRRLYESGALLCPGFTPMALPEDLRQLRAECGRGPQHPEYTHMTVVTVDNKQYPVIAEEASIRVAFTEEGRKRLRELRDAAPAPPAAKRARVLAASANIQRFPKLEDLLSQFNLRNRQSVTIDGKAVNMLRAESKTSEDIVLHYLHNTGDGRVVLRKHAQVATSSKMEVYDRLLPDGAEALSKHPELIAYPYKWSTDTLFVYRFGAAEEVISDFGRMISAAKTSHSGDVKTYGHNLSDMAASSASAERIVVPHASRRSDLLIQPEKLSDAQWSADMMVNFLTQASIAAPAETGILLPVHRVKLQEGGGRNRSDFSAYLDVWVAQSRATTIIATTIVTNKAIAIDVRFGSRLGRSGQRARLGGRPERRRRVVAGRACGAHGGDGVSHPGAPPVL